MPRLLESLFRLDARNTTALRELRGALATFLTMAYILFANPNILQRQAYRWSRPSPPPP